MLMNYGNYDLTEGTEIKCIILTTKEKEKKDCIFTRRVYSVTETILVMKKINTMNYEDSLIYVTALNRKKYRGMSKEWKN